MLCDLIPEAEKIIREKYNVLDIIKFTEYDDNIELISQRLRKIIKVNFDPNDRIIFVHSDVDYYLPSQINFPGFSICNLQIILNELNIPNHFVILISNHKHIDGDLNLARQLYSNDVETIQNVYTLLFQFAVTTANLIPLEFNPHIITKHYACLNGSNRHHRTKFMHLLSSYDLLHFGMVSYQQVIKDLPELKTEYTKMNSVFLTTKPHLRVNDSWDSSKINAILKGSAPEAIVLDSLAENPATQHQFPELQKCFVNIITESVFNYPHVYLSEKTFKGITAKRPFIILGPPGTLKELRNLGFRTFDSYFDESYDAIKDPADRMLAVYNEVTKICSKSIAELQKMLFDMQEDIEYNFNHYAKFVYKGLIDLKRL